jgi:hypothetical protein
MPDTEKRSNWLADQFAVLEKNLRAAPSAEQRAELLKRMNAVIVIEELDQLILVNQSPLDSELSTVPTSVPYRSPDPQAR